MSQCYLEGILKFYSWHSKLLIKSFFIKKKEIKDTGSSETVTHRKRLKKPKKPTTKSQTNPNILAYVFSREANCMQWKNTSAVPVLPQPELLKPPFLQFPWFALYGKKSSHAR